MSKRTQDDLSREEREAKHNEARDRLTVFLQKNVTDPGIFVVLVDRETGIIVAAFTYSLTTITHPSNHGVKAAYERLCEKEKFKEMDAEAQYHNIQHFACGVDGWNRKLAGGTLVQAAMSSAAGLDIITYSDDSQLASKEISNKLKWTCQSGGTMVITKTVTAAMGYVGGIHSTAMEAFDPDAFERVFLEKLDKELACLHFAQTLNKIVFYDLPNSNNLADVAPTSTHTTTTEVTLPTFPLPF